MNEKRKLLLAGVIIGLLLFGGPILAAAAFFAEKVLLVTKVVVKIALVLVGLLCVVLLAREPQRDSDGYGGTLVGKIVGIAVLLATAGTFFFWILGTVSLWAALGLLILGTACLVALLFLFTAPIKTVIRIIAGILILSLLLGGFGPLDLFAKIGEWFTAEEEVTQVVTESETKAEVKAKEELTPEQLKQLRQILTVDDGTLSAGDLMLNMKATPFGNVVEFDIGAVKSMPPRKWSDAISIPFQEKEPEKMKKEIQKTFFTDPLIGSMFAHYLANLELAEVKIAELNPWLEPWVGGTELIAKNAAYYMPLFGKSGEASEAELKLAAQRNLEWQELAGKLATLLERTQLVGVITEQSVKNYHLAGGGLVAGALPEVELNVVQENLPSLQFAVTVKGQEESLLTFGFNIEDKRVEEFGSKPIPPTVKAKPEPAPTTTGSVPTPEQPEPTSELEPKSADPKDYVYPEGKQKVPIVESNPENPKTPEPEDSLTPPKETTPEETTQKETAPEETTPEETTQKEEPNEEYPDSPPPLEDELSEEPNEESIDHPFGP